jgi:16S rRNA C967 or C1407 C5-methylase (RsmB/RsmF family)
MTLVSEAGKRGSIPLWLVVSLSTISMNASQQFKDMIADLLPSQSEQDAFFAFFQQSLKKSLSIITHRSSNFKNEHTNFQLSNTPFAKEFPDTVYVDREDTTIALGKTRQHLTGQFYIQEVAASLPANILKWHLNELKIKNKEPLKILDLCAAPWGKTAQLADFLLAQHIPWVIRGNDVDGKRLATWASNIQRCGLYNTVATKLDGSQIGQFVSRIFRCDLGRCSL